LILVLQNGFNASLALLRYHPSSELVGNFS